MNFVWGWWLIVAEMGPGQVWVQVVDVDVAADREITFGKSLAQARRPARRYPGRNRGRFAGGSKEPEVAGIAGRMEVGGGIGLPPGDEPGQWPQPQQSQQRPQPVTPK